MSGDALDPTRHSLYEIFRRQAENSLRTAREGFQQLLEKARDKLNQNARDPEAYLAISWCLRKLDQPDEAMAILSQGVRLCAPSHKLWRARIELLEWFNRTGEAIAAARQAAVLFPDDFFLKLKIALMLPYFYDSPDQVAFFRRRFEQGLQTLSEELKLDTPEARQSALAGIGRHSNMLLAYQAQNDRELQIRYGELVSRIMAANYPQWTTTVAMPPAGRPLRIGYVSSRFRDLSATKLYFGWFQHHDPARFEVYAYYAGAQTDVATDQVRQACFRFHHLPDHLEDLARAILADRLHILVFLDVGMDAITTQLAALRLAPVQCMAWDQPVTSGLPAMDYFISSELMEPPGASGHYSETLVCLPGVGVHFPRPVIPTLLLHKSRADLHLREDAVIYLCCQSVMKYLPEHDDLFVEIARRVPRAQFAFLTPSRPLAQDLQERLDRVFDSAGLRAADFCVMLPQTDRFTYWNRYLLSDVFLDTVGWSGGVSTFEAIACRLPVVTLPGNFLRGRHSSAILTQLGVPDTIASDKAGYVEIAARLGLDREWRASIIERMVSGFPSLYSDQRPVVAWEDFLTRTAGLRF